MRAKNSKYLAILEHMNLGTTRLHKIFTRKNFIKSVLICVNLWFYILIFCFLLSAFVYSGPLSGKIIIVDPGHAAKNSNGEIINYGCKSASDVKEMDIVIDISEILGEMFLQNGATIYFTRDRQNYWRTAESQDVDNQARAEFANSKNADLFLRVHCNWSPRKKKCGVSILWYKDDSKKIAETVYEEIKKSGVIVDGMHKQQLVGFEFAKVPSILIEYGYLSNKEDEKLLKDKEYLKKISKVIVNGLNKHFAEEKNAGKWK
ncbi:MAG: N-acetylmuramoyl-L-alanine amidase [Elusimicrobia bacterium]|nr:N-acetylmuramoyl-L-alanine amidase [Elusimicrobiota bacterium]